MCLCGDWDPKQVDRQIAIRKYKARMMNADPRGPGGWAGMRDPYEGAMGGEMMDGPPRIGLPPGLAAGLGSGRGTPRPDTEAFFEPLMGSRSHAGGGSRHAGGSRRASGRHSNMYEAAGGPVARWPPGPAESFNRRGGPPPSGGGVWMHGALGGSQADDGRGRSSSRGPPAGRDPPPGFRAHAAAMATIRGPMPPGMQMGGRSNSRRSSRSGL